jgi:membrane-associated HD superfamily phosphohydrolase
MGLQALLNIALLLAFLAALAFAVYVKVKSNSFTRERYAFAALAATIALVALGIHSISTKPSWSAIGHLWHSALAENLPQTNRSLGPNSF